MTRAIETVSLSELAAFIRQRKSVKEMEIISVHQTQDPHRLFIELEVSNARPASVEVITSANGKPMKLLEYYEEPEKSLWDWTAAGL